MIRNILGSEPRVTRFKINWDDTPSNGLPEHSVDGASMDATISTSIQEDSTSTIIKSTNNDMFNLNNGSNNETNNISLLNENSNSLAQMECA